MTIDVILPVLEQQELTLQVLDCLAKCNPRPNKVYLIDNAGFDSDLFRRLTSENSENVRYFALPRNIGVNASWNLGLALSNADYVMFLNNDVLLPAFLFSQIQKTFEKYPSVGLVIPNTIDSQDAVFLAHEPEETRLVSVPKREGWCFTLPRNIALSIGWIPASNTTFFGDDWFYQGIARRNLNVVKMQDVPIFHYGSVTVNATGLIHTLRKEREAWQNNQK